MVDGCRGVCFKNLIRTDASVSRFRDKFNDQLREIEQALPIEHFRDRTNINEDSANAISSL